MYSACTSKRDRGVWRWHVVVYVDRPDDALRKGVELVEGGMVEACGPGGAGFAEKCGWGGVVDGFERGAPGYGDE